MEAKTFAKMLRSFIYRLDHETCVTALNTDAVFTQQLYMDEKNIYGQKAKWPAKNF